jgi:tetratricopeptide (TPR) repeat protein
MGEHYSPEEIEEGLSGRLPKEKSREILRHLLHGCLECQDAVRREDRFFTAPQEISLPPKLSAAYDSTLERAEDFARRAAALPSEERPRFQEALSFLRAGGDVLDLAETGDMELAGLGVCEALLARSWAVRYDDPRQMCNLARAAVEVAHRLDPEAHGAWKVADWAARAWGELANACRVSDRLRKAEKAFSTAYSFYQQGSKDRKVLMRLLDLEASLLGTLREFDIALERLSSLAELYRSAGEAHLAGRTLITKSLYLYYKGPSPEAYKTLTEGFGLIDEDRDPSLVTVATLNQLLLMEDCGRFKEARRFLFKNRARISGAGHILALKVRGIEGRINYGLGELESAEISFREVKKGFSKAGLDFASAIEGLDLAMTLMRQGRTEEAVQEIMESTAMFIRLNIHRELIGSVLCLQEALFAEAASLSLLESTVRFLRRKQIELGIK